MGKNTDCGIYTGAKLGPEESKALCRSPSLVSSGSQIILTFASISLPGVSLTVHHPSTLKNQVGEDVIT